jgi:hypothetical protein
LTFQFEVGLKYAHELIEGTDTQQLVHQDDIVEKLHFDLADIIAVSVAIDDERSRKGNPVLFF